ncbi:MAG: deoxyribose-phosphate aldolase [Candidatus Omnitrophota bacterium]|jgi:deoxyribose-phosphate aldolase
MNYTKEQIAAALDYAVLKPTATLDDVQRACFLAQREHFASVCVRPCDVQFAAQFCDVPISTVVGFPHGTNAPEIKRLEAQQAIRDGAEELDIVMNYSRLLGKDYAYVYNELLYITERLPLKPIIKVILETCYLTPEQITSACLYIQKVPRASFVKTSTGFGSGGATCMAVEIMAEAIKTSTLQIKASGGINTYQDVCTFLDLGCTRLGSSKWSELLPC